ncbi:MAG: efflux RND transporter permease subunit [Gemmatimonadaceae bacterium]|nr:efflux RND transporter permease subunit [Gemmatimonadaceae bacterium]
MSLTSAAVRKPVTTIAAVLAIVLLGSVSLSRLPVTLLPDVTLPVLTIRTTYTGAAAEEVSRFIAEPIEEAIAATPGIVELRSVSRNGEAVTTARFAWGTDMQTTVLTVRERLDQARGRLPEAAARPTLLTSDPGERPIAVIGLTGLNDLRLLGRTAEDVHARRLEQIGGVASVAVTGAPEDEIRIEVAPERMRALGLTTDDVARAVQAANANGAGGTIRRGQFRFSVRAMTEFRQLDEIAGTPIGPAGADYALRDIATITSTLAEPRTLTRLDGGAAVGLVVYKDAGANTVAVTSELRKVIAQLESEFPDIRMHLVAAQADFVVDALSNLGQEIVLGGILSLVMILVFLKDWRSSLAIAAILPLSVLIALVFLQLFDVTVNVLSLGGLALGVGLLVDNAIVVADAAGRRREETGDGSAGAAIDATDEVAGPLIAGTLTTLLVFGPIVFVKGLAAALFRDLSLAVVLSVGGSLVLALTLMPVMLVGKRKRGAGAAMGSTGAGGAGMEEGERVHVAATAAPPPSALDRLGAVCAELYERGMEWALRSPRAMLGLGVGLFILMIVLLYALPKEILPQVDEGMVVAAVQLPEGTAIEETTRQVGRVEAAATGLGAVGIYSRVGIATDEEVLAGAEPGTSATAQLLIPVPDGRDAAGFAQALREAVPDLAAGGLALDLAGQSEFGSLIGREGRLVRVEVSARNLAESQQWADSVRRRLAGLATLSDVRDAFASTQPQVEVTLERERLAERGITVQQVQRALQGGLGGVEASELRETDRRTPIRVRFAGNANEDLLVALQTPLNGVPLSNLVSTREVRAPIEVVRVDQRPVSIVEGLVSEGGTARATADVQRALAALTPPAGLTWRVTGADVEQRRTTSELALVALLSVALVFLVLAGEFASFTIPLVVMITVPLAAAGGFALLWLMGQSINAVSLIGIVVMIGMADNEAVVKLDAIRRFREEGHSIHEAVLRGGRQRLRAITMTSLTTVLGVLPLVLGVGSGGALYQPLAAAVVGGAISAQVVTFFLLPVAYARLEAWQERRRAAAAARDGRPAAVSGASAAPEA